MDGDLSNVNPALLELTKDPTLWREQRRKAMKAKIFGATPNEGEVASSYLPLDGTPEQQGSSMQTPSYTGSQDDHEAYVLAQLQSRKRQRLVPQEPQFAPTSDSPSGTAGGESLKAKLLQKFGRQ